MGLLWSPSRPARNKVASLEPRGDGGVAVKNGRWFGFYRNINCHGGGLYLNISIYIYKIYIDIYISWRWLLY